MPRRPPRCSLPASCLALGLLAVAAPSAAAAPLSFQDGDRRVGLERLGPRVLDEVGRELTPVALHYEGRAAVRALIDRTAIVTLDPGGEAALEARGVRLVRPLMPSIGLWLVEDETGGDGVDAAARLGTDDARALGVREVVPNLYLRTEPRGTPFTPNDPLFGGQWFFANLHMPDAWGITKGDAKTTVVVVDTGCDLTHPDLAAKMDQGKDVVSGDNDPSPNLADKGAAHGTSCAGLVGAVTNNGVGIAGGCPECRIRCVRMLSDQPVPMSADVDAFQFAFDVGAAVVSNSWGFVDPMPVPKALADAINNVFDHGRGGKGALVVFAAGNDSRVLGNDEMEAVRGVLCIGAINNNGDQAPFTNTGPAIDLVAPTGTLTTDIAGAAGEDPSDYTTALHPFGGTSSACPVVAGIAGLVVSAAPDKTSAELYDLLVKTASPAPYAVPDANGHDDIYGYGIVDPVAALDKVLGLGAGGGGGGGAGAGGGKVAPHAATPAPALPAASGCGCAIPEAPPGALAFGLYSMALGVAFARRRRPSSRRRG